MRTMCMEATMCLLELKMLQFQHLKLNDTGLIYGEENPKKQPEQAVSYNLSHIC